MKNTATVVGDMAKLTLDDYDKLHSIQKRERQAVLLDQGLLQVA